MNLIEWLEKHSLPCAYHQLFGIECPACGSQRALIELLKGNILESIKLQPALIPTFLLVFLILIQPAFRSKKLWKYIKILAISDLVILITGYILKLIF